MKKSKFKDLANFLIQEADAAKSADTAKIIETNRPPRGENLSHRHAVHTAVDKSRSRSPHKSKKCFYCLNECQDISDCRAFKNKTTNDRWDWMKKDRRCFNCLAAGHSRRSCEEFLCKIRRCKRPYHFLLHLFPEEQRNVRTNFLPQAHHLPKKLVLIMQND